MNRPWENEPNRVEFKYKGYHCLINRAHPLGSNPEVPKDWSGHLCGYVAVPKGHPFYEETWEGDGDKKVYDLNVHGGITYANHCQGDICHKTEEDDDVWWLGFDCAHFGDLCPAIWEMRQPGGILHDIHMSYGGKSHESYKTVAFVKNEIRNLVKQLEKVA